MPGTLNVGGHDIITHSGTAGAGTINLVDQAGNTILTDSGSGMSISSNVAFPAGHIVQISSATYNFTGDVGITTTSEVFGPVLSMTMVNANAQIFCIYTMGEFYANNVSFYLRLAYKTTTFTAGQGNTSHNASLMTEDNYFKSRYSSQGVHTVNLFGTILNSAGQTIYFAPEGFVFGGGTFYPNYGGTNANMRLTIMEIQQ